MTPPVSPTPLLAVSVVVPARNEERLIGRCLAAIDVSAKHLTEHTSGTVTVYVVVVADTCSDDTEAIARQYGATVVAATHGAVGAARRTGVDAALQRAAPLPRHWIANTDADSAVPKNWLFTHITLANSGADVVIGLVQPEAHGLTHAQHLRWQGAHPPLADHPHVFGANLGIRASTYRAAGGFAPVAVGEDRALLNATRRMGANILTTNQATVVTSSRRIPRAPNGFAAWLHAN